MRPEDRTCPGLKNAGLVCRPVRSIAHEDHRNTARFGDVGEIDQREQGSRDIHMARYRTEQAEIWEDRMRQLPPQTGNGETRVAEKLIKISKIKIGDRHRKDLGDIEGLAQSIKARGLLQPIGVNGQYVLMFGARRLAGCKLLGWTEIPPRIIKVDSVLAAEFDENEFREAFTVSERIQILEDLRKQHAITHGGSRKPLSYQDQKIGLEEAAVRAGFRNTETYSSS